MQFVGVDPHSSAFSRVEEGVTMAAANVAIRI